MRMNNLGNPPDPGSEYIASQHAILDSTTRGFQATSILAASAVTGAIVLASVLPSENFPDWMKLLSVWTFVGIITPLMLFWVVIALSESLAARVAIHRMIELELQTSARRVLYTCLLRDWANRDQYSEWHALPEAEREDLERKIRGGVLSPLPAPVFWGVYSLRPGVPLITVVFLPSAVIALASLGASVATVWVLTTGP